MIYWLRELAGWALVLLGLGVFYICLGLLVNPEPRILSSIPLLFVGFFVFRGGIHLLKVAVAARVCINARKQMKK